MVNNISERKQSNVATWWSFAWTELIVVYLEYTRLYWTLKMLVTYFLLPQRELYQAPWNNWTLGPPGKQNMEEAY